MRSLNWQVGKASHLSQAGRTILIKTVLGLIPPYYMATSITKEDSGHYDQNNEELLVGSLERYQEDSFH